MRFLHALSIAWLAVACAAGRVAADPSETNGFRLEGARVPRELIVAGGPGRDGIKSIDAPEFAPVDEATWVGPATTVIGVEVRGEARGYPVHVMEYHQIANDELSGVPVVVTYDPIAGSPVAWRRTLGDRTLTFGASGLLYNANFLLYDRETESLWCQITGEAIAGELAGEKLERLRARQEPRDTWLARQPGSLFLVPPARKHIDYRYSPFQGYWLADRIPYPVAAKDERYHAKELVVGVTVDGISRAYLGSIVTAHGGSVSDEIAGRRIRMLYDSPRAVFTWEVPDGVEPLESYWFAWKAFHPDTQIWNDTAEGSKAAPSEKGR